MRGFGLACDRHTPPFNEMFQRVHHVTHTRRFRRHTRGIWCRLWRASSKKDSITLRKSKESEVERVGSRRVGSRRVTAHMAVQIPTREKLLDYYEKNKNPADPEENLLTCLADLFTQISVQKKKTGVIAPKRFVQRVRKENELFRGYMHQDAHEFLNFLLNELVDILEKESSAAKDTTSGLSIEKVSNGNKNGTNGVQEPLVTWVHKNFQGILTNETRCLRCETVTARDETFFDLSLDIEQNSSITSCLKNFSSTETLNAEDKFFCDKCCSLQEAQKRMKIKKPPHILVIHLKRFKYMENLSRYKKLSYRVVFPLELKLTNTVEDADSEYSLFAVVIHVGTGPNHGHYVSLVKSHNHWLFFDDENVDMIDESAVQTFFGSAQEYSSNSEHGYILFYEKVSCVDTTDASSK